MFTQWSIVVLLIIAKECCSQQVYRRQANQDVREFDRDTPCDFATAARPEWCHFDTNVTVRTLFGDVKGFNIPWHSDDEIPYQSEWHRFPPNVTRRINCFLGIPYAQAPVEDLRFKRPEDPRWVGRDGSSWNATHYRPVCPQPLDRIRRDIPNFSRLNMSEDCLYLNIFAPNYTIYNDHYAHYAEQLWPVLVWFNSGTFIDGAAQVHPGHVLATQEIVVVTVNYRLGALGFMSTQDEECTGNWGLFDQQKALEFVKQNIKAFRGDPDRITIAGDGAGAASVGFHLLSDMTRDKQFFHRCIMMSGTDLSASLFVNSYWRPRDYAHELADLLDCYTDDTYRMMQCMRKVDWRRLLDLQELVEPKDGPMGVVWAPTQDGGWFMDNPMYPQVPYLRYQPRDMREQGLYERIPCIIGLNSQDGAERANVTLPQMRRGLFRRELQDFIGQLLDDWQIQPIHAERALDAVEFQYTHWPDPENNTARSQEFINLMTDLDVGIGMDEVLKLQSRHEAQWMYQFNFNSWNNWLPDYMGVAYSQAVPYVFGVPFMNETRLPNSGLLPRQLYDYEDRNMSEWMMDMWTNFVKEGTPTPNITYNITWDPFNFQNLSYLLIDHHSHIWYRYRQEKYSFWREYFPEIAKQEHYFPTPTPAGFEYAIATGGMSALVVVLWAAAGFLCMLIWMRSKEDRYMQEFPEYALQPSTMPPPVASRTVSQSSLAAASQPRTRQFPTGSVNPSASISSGSGASAYTPSAKPQYSKYMAASGRDVDSSSGIGQSSLYSYSKGRSHIGHSVC